LLKCSFLWLEQVWAIAYSY